MSNEANKIRDCKHPVRVNVEVDDAPVEVCIKCKRVTGIYWRDDLNK